MLVLKRVHVTAFVTNEVIKYFKSIFHIQKVTFKASSRVDNKVANVH